MKLTSCNWDASSERRKLLVPCVYKNQVTKSIQSQFHSLLNNEMIYQLLSLSLHFSWAFLFRVNSTCCCINLPSSRAAPTLPGSLSYSAFIRRRVWSAALKTKWLNEELRYDVVYCNCLIIEPARGTWTEDGAAVALWITVITQQVSSCCRGLWVPVRCSCRTELSTLSSLPLSHLDSGGEKHIFQSAGVQNS